MYKLIIVEDEDKIRNGLENLIDWNEMGFEVTGSFHDGSKALEYVAESDVHVVLTDIRMGEVSGIDLAREIRKCGLHTHIVFLSGYKDFEYAKNAVNLSVENYLLKPVKLEELYKTFTSLKQKLDEEIARKDSVSNLKKRFNHALPYIEEQFLYNILTGTIGTKEQLQSKLNILGNDFFEDFIVLSVIEIAEHERWLYGSESLRVALLNFVKELNFEGVTLHTLMYEDTKSILFFTGKKENMNPFNRLLNSRIPLLKNNIEELLKLKVIIVRSECYYDPLLSCSVYLEMRKNMARHAKTGTNESLYPECKDGESGVFRGHIDYKRLLECIFEGDHESVKNVLAQVIAHISQMEKDELQIRNTIINMISTITAKVTEIAGENKAFGNFDYAKLFLADNIIQARKLVEDYIISITDFFTRNNLKTNYMLLTRVKAYIDEHYAKDISINSMSKLIFLNPSYFSRVFKECIGVNFIDYLTDVRMQKAKELLNNRDIKVYEVAERVGYKSQKYFSRLFKHNTGFSPTEYQNLKDGNRE